MIIFMRLPKKNFLCSVDYTFCKKFILKVIVLGLNIFNNRKCH